MEAQANYNRAEKNCLAMTAGCFIISLDFELHWGGFEKWPLKKYSPYFDATRNLIPQLIKVFERSGIHCTWATVGLLLHTNESEIEYSIPNIRPGYNNSQLSAYNYIKSVGIGQGEEEDPYHYADSLVRQIIHCPGQELASHSFAHYYCNEPGQTVKQFVEDAKSWNKAAGKYEVKARSLVFPRNQFNEDYLLACHSVGIEIVRTNPLDWWWQIDSTTNESKWKRLNRGMDAYFNLGGKTSFALADVKKAANVWMLPASRLLRPFKPKELFLNDLKVRRIKRELEIAAKNNECYHLWWHPHNFGWYPKQNMQGLIEIINHYSYLRKEYNMQSLNMGEIAALLPDA